MLPPPPVRGQFVFAALEELPLVAILRGVQPDEVVEVAGAVVNAGIRAIEVPLNSPEPYRSLRRLCDTYGTTCLCGAGTVLEPSQVDRVHEVGGSLIVAPNTDTSVIRRALDLRLVAMPGFATATEAFAAVAAGAQYLKLFPAATYGLEHVRALRCVLPRSIRILAVGGIVPAALGEWRRAGVYGFGVGSEIYRVGIDVPEISRRASAIVTAYRACDAVC